MNLDKLIGIRAILERLSSQKCKISTAYKVAKLFNNTDNDYKFYKEKLMELLNDYGAVDKDGRPLSNDNGIIIKDDKLDEFNNLFNELIKTEINTEIPKFKIEEFEGMEATATEMYTLMPIIEE